MSDRPGPVQVPRLGARTADTHAHLDMLDDPAGALERAAMAGVMLVNTVTDVTESAESTFESLSAWIAEAEARMRDRHVPHPSAPVVRIVVGCHPHNAKDFGPDAEETLLRLARDPRVGAIGEAGLDFHYDHSPRDDQRRVFRRQLELAAELELPVVVHLREAHGEGLAILREMGLPPAGCVIHCFTLGPAEVADFLDLDCYVSFAGPVTFPKGDAIREAAALVPLDRLLVETDCPFMAPVPHRGKTNEPGWCTFNAARIAEARGLSPAEVAAAVMDNARRLFRAPEAEADR